MSRSVFQNSSDVIAGRTKQASENKEHISEIKLSDCVWVIVS